MIRKAAPAFAAFLLTAPSLVAACSPSSFPTLNLFDYPIAIMADCSFTEAGEGRFSNGTGSSPIDLGNGRIAQDITFGADWCSADRVLLVVDCSAVESALFGNREYPEDPNVGGFHGYSATTYDFNPLTEQPTRDAANMSIAQIGSLAEEMHISVEYDVDAFLDRMRLGNRFNPYCGCSVLYPDSPGARQ